jgi:hypothetical protein
MPLTDQEREACHAAYPKVLEAIDGLPVHAAFALMGSVFSFILQETDRDFAHRVVDQFSVTTHQLIDKS